MEWQDIRRQYPSQWLLVEAVQAHTEEDRRIVSDLAVLRTCQDAANAMDGYLELHRKQPERELYVLHTDREDLEIQERRWLGVRAG